jgi:3-hydroxypropanoate dehydrogenase
VTDEIEQARSEIRALRERMTRLDDDALDLLFRKARSHTVWLDGEVADSRLRELHELMKYGPTASNGLSARIVFVKSAEAKEKLRPTLRESNLVQTMDAPVTAIIGYDPNFFELLPRLFPLPGLDEVYRKDPERAERVGYLNATLQGAYFIVAARALGFDTGAVNGFDNQAVDAAFFQGSTVKSIFLCNIGHADLEHLHPVHPRLDFDEVCQIV